MGRSMTNASSEAKRKRRSWLGGITVRLVKEKPLGAVCAVVTLLIILTAIFADFIAPYGVNETRLTDFFAPPSAAYPMGADQLGRDVFSRIIFGARISVIVGLSATSIAVALSLIIGGVSGYIGGKLDLTVQRFVDAGMCFPGIIFAIAMVSLAGPGMLTVTIVLGVIYGIGASRIIRGAVMSTKENIYVAAAVAIGCSPSRILIRHIVPNIMAPTIVIFTTRVPAVVLAEASLSFLGFGIPPPAPSWGGMINGARTFMYVSPGLAIWPGLALSSLVFSTNLFGDALRDLLDPRLRGGAGRYGTRVKKKPTVKSEPSAQKG